MKEPKFTPGPWKHSGEKDADWWDYDHVEISGENNKPLAEVSWYCATKEELEGNMDVTGRFKANAYLITTAPEMYGVLEHFYELIQKANKGDTVSDCKIYEDVLLIEQVLKKARGEK